MNPHPPEPRRRPSWGPLAAACLAAAPHTPTSAQLFAADAALQAEALHALPSPRADWPVGTVLRLWQDAGRLRVESVPVPAPALAQALGGVRRAPFAPPLARFHRHALLAGVMERHMAALQLGPLPLADFPADTVLTLQAGDSQRETLDPSAAPRIAKAVVASGLKLPARYVVITGTVSMQQVTAQFSGASLGPVAQALAGHSATVAGLQVGSADFRLQRRYDKPWQIFYSYEDLRPNAGAAIGAPDVEVDLLPGLTPLPLPEPAPLPAPLPASGPASGASAASAGGGRR